MEAVTRDACEPTYQQRTASCPGTHVQDIVFLFWQALIEGMEEINRIINTVKERLGAHACPDFELALIHFWFLCINHIWEDSGSAAKVESIQRF